MISHRIVTIVSSPISVAPVCRNAYAFYLKRPLYVFLTDQDHRSLSLKNEQILIKRNHDCKRCTRTLSFYFSRSPVFYPRHSQFNYRSAFSYLALGNRKSLRIRSLFFLYRLIHRYCTSFFTLKIVAPYNRLALRHW